MNMPLTEAAKILLLILMIVCAVSVNLTDSLLQAVIIFMSYSSMMCVIWILMESPDLAITEAAVGAGVSGVLFLAALRQIREADSGRRESPEEGTEAGRKEDRAAEREEKDER